MSPEKLLGLLARVRDGQLDPEQACQQLAQLPFEDVEFAQLDRHRELRQGFPEVVFGQDKTPEQMLELLRRLEAGHGRAMATRVAPEVGPGLAEQLGVQARFYPRARLLTVGSEPAEKKGLVVVACAGTSDLPVAEEASLTLGFMGSRCELVTDVGVAGLHRVLHRLEVLRQARAVVVVAGMDGALASVIGGLVACPVIGVPTSIGYGANFSGVAPLLTMLNSCAPGVTVVNIDNGFGGAYAAHRINLASQ